MRVEAALLTLGKKLGLYSWTTDPKVLPRGVQCTSLHEVVVKELAERENLKQSEVAELMGLSALDEGGLALGDIQTRLREFWGGTRKRVR